MIIAVVSQLSVTTSQPMLIIIVTMHGIGLWLQTADYSYEYQLNLGNDFSGQMLVGFKLHPSSAPPSVEANSQLNQNA